MIDPVSAVSLEHDFNELRASEVNGISIVARELPVDDAYLAVNSAGDCMFIIRDTDGAAAPSRRLKLLNVDYVIRLTAELGGKSITDSFTVVALPNRNSELIPAFATLLSLLLTHESQNSNESNLRQVVESLVDLFTPRTGNVRDRAKGLFGELSVISASGDPVKFINAWHDSLNANKDFSLPDRYLEVKTTEGTVRKHDVGMSQLHTDNTKRPIYVASVLLEEDPSGTSVVQLFENIRDSLSDIAAQVKLTKECLESFGLDYEELSELRFSVTGGLEGIWVFAADDLPRPTLDSNSAASQAISGVKFALNFDLLDALGTSHKLLHH